MQKKIEEHRMKSCRRKNCIERDGIHGWEYQQKDDDREGGRRKKTKTKK